MRAEVEIEAPQNPKFLRDSTSTQQSKRPAPLPPTGPVVRGAGGKRSSVGIRDEVDEAVYGYALRVSYINNLLQAAFSVPSSSRTPDPNSSYFPSPGGSGHPSPAISPGGRGGFFGKKKDKEGKEDKESIKERERAEKERERAERERERGEVKEFTKLPKEFVVAFWEVLGSEEGDVVWKQTTSAFIARLPNRKATKTRESANLREIPILLAFFGSFLPPPTPQAPIHQHQMHLISLLLSSLENWFSPMGSQKGKSEKEREKDRETLAKLRGELEGLLGKRPASTGQPSPGFEKRISAPGARIPAPSISSPLTSPSFASSNSTGNSPFYEDDDISGSLSKSRRSSGATSVHTVGGQGQRLSRRGSSFLANITPPGSPRVQVSEIPPVPALSGQYARRKEVEPEMLDLTRVVGRVFGVEDERLRADLEGLRRGGLDERSYFSDLKLHLATLTAIPSSELSNPQADRIRSLQLEISTLLAARPDLSSSMHSTPIPTLGGSDMHFTPSRGKDSVFCRLVERVREMLGPDSPLVAGEDGDGERELVELCAGVWGIRGKRTKELVVTTQLWEKAYKGWVHALGRGAGEDMTERIGMRKRMLPAEERKREAELMGWVSRIGEDLEAVGEDVEDGMEEDLEQDLKSFLTETHRQLYNIMLDAILSIYPLNNTRLASTPLEPNASAIAFLNTLSTSTGTLCLLPDYTKQWANTSDELKGRAVREYAHATQKLLVQDTGVGGMGAGGAGEDEVMKGFEKMADWIESGLSAVLNVWRKEMLLVNMDPPAIILSKQLPLFLAEMQVLDQPSPNGKAEDIFPLYERVARLMELWSEMCPSQEIGFDLDAFFEPHVRKWLKDAEDVDTHQWVSRAVGMDSWVPDGTHRHSQSVVDLFEFIRQSLKTVLTDLPLGEYNRAIYLIDFSKTASGAISSYASTVEGLFMSEMMPAKSSTPAELPQLSGKAGAWLAKGKQAVKSLDRKKVDGFLVPPEACVKLTDMGAARMSVEDLMIAMEAKETEQIVREHKLRTGGVGREVDRPARYLFTVTVSRGENLYSKNLSKAADGFVTVLDASNESRILKTQTVLGRVDPSWDESIDLSVGGAKFLEVSCWDRLLMGKHDLIGKGSIKLDPAAFKNQDSRDIVLPLHPRGVVHLRVDLEGGEKHEVQFYLERACRSLDRASEAMTRCIVDRLYDYIKQYISASAMQNTLKPLSAKPKKGTAKVTALSEQDVEASLAPLTEYLDQNFSTFAMTLSEEVKLRTMSRIWERILDSLISLLIPPLSDTEASGDGLAPHEISLVFQWLKILKSFFNASENGQEMGVPMSTLQAGLYKEILLIGQYLDLPAPVLKEKCVAAVKGAARPANARGMAGEDDAKTAEILLRIIRMRKGPQTNEFLSHNIGQLNQARMQRQGGIA